MEWLNYHHLYYFWVAAKEGGVSRAAEKLRLAQPTLSAQIRALGQSLGGELFARRGRGLVLTELGTLVYQHADEIFGIGQELLDAVKGRSGGRIERLVVGIADVLPKLVVYRMLEPAFHLDPPVRLVCREGPVDRLVAALGAHELDLVLSDCPLSPSSGTRAFNHLLGESGTTIFAAPKLAAKLGRGFPKSLDGAPFVIPGRQSVLRRELDGWLDSHQVRPQVVAEVDDSALAKVLGQAGVGAFVGPSAMEADICEQYAVKVLGRVPALKERYFAISLERRIRHPGVLAISSAARELLSA
ncbi:MAG: transcriptional activator NhaR [Polyangiaceae bacterium]|nr:transcriptional activator NhaR [Myxococcales bacterium]MCC6898535.1 transcriptional activator NhaR [Polyangiaceae bacterium]